MKLKEIKAGKDIVLDKDYIVTVQEYERYGGGPSTSHMTGQEIVDMYGEDPEMGEGVFAGIDYMLSSDNGEDVLEISEIVL